MSEDADMQTRIVCDEDDSGPIHRVCTVVQVGFLTPISCSLLSLVAPRNAAGLSSRALVGGARHLSSRRRQIVLCLKNRSAGED